MEVNAGHVEGCPLVSHVEYAPCILLRSDKSGQTDGRTLDRCITLTSRRGSRSRVVSLTVAYLGIEKHGAASRLKCTLPNSTRVYPMNATFELEFQQFVS